ncbi:TetR/AcrR family transcriptional regulator [Salinarimonas chemoclinalis]|uniref:TetR/AcrR family transcriptional regulator n=1 Tax=Salinarimonas chemoclinalis TaxID=3241599 RepID=UPI003558C87C
MTAGREALAPQHGGVPEAVLAGETGRLYLDAMDTDPSEPPEAVRRKTYHHGNLREALVEAARVLIEEKGPLGFTMAEAARAAGVSPAAPYRHFAGREELIEAVALQGFTLFAERLESATEGGENAPLKAFTAAGNAYLDFARSNPGYYIAMFESGVAISANAQLNRMADRAMAVLRLSAERLSAHLPAAKRPPAGMVANHIWAFSHGVVELFGRGRPGARAPYSAEEMLESGTAIYLRGLGLIP